MYRKSFIWMALGLLLVTGVLIWRSMNKNNSYPYMDQPIESINYWIGYYKDTTHDSKGFLGTIPLIDTVFTLDQYIKKNSQDTLGVEELSRLQLTFAFMHKAPRQKDGSELWRVANQGGIMLGNVIPVEVKEEQTGKTYGFYEARSTRTHNFEFKLKLDKALPHLSPGNYGLIIHTARADIPQDKREWVKNIFPPKFYPTYLVKIRIPPTPKAPAAVLP